MLLQTPRCGAGLIKLIWAHPANHRTELFSHHLQRFHRCGTSCRLSVGKVPPLHIALQDLDQKSLHGFIVKVIGTAESHPKVVGPPGKFLLREQQLCPDLATKAIHVEVVASAQQQELQAVFEGGQDKWACTLGLEFPSNRAPARCVGEHH